MKLIRLTLLATLLFLATLLAIIHTAVALRTMQQHGIGLAADQIPAQTGIPPIGITAQLEQYNNTDRQAALHRLQAHGFGWVRQRIDWATLEPAPNQFDWQSSDALINAIVDQPLTPIILLDGSPAWARAPLDADNPLAPPADPQHFARFAQAVAQRYAEKVRFYQIWDEPNIAPHWGSRWVEPTEYARLLHSASSAIRRTDPDAVIIAAALAPTTDLGHAAIYETHYLRRLIASTRPNQLPNQPLFDIVAIQPYGFGHPPSDTRQRRDILNFQRAAHIRRALVAAGHADTPIWAVRFGWNRTPNSPWASVPPARQTDFTAAAIQHARANWPWLQTLGWHIDQPAAPPPAPVWGFALTENLAQQIGAAAQASIPTTAAPPIPWVRIWIAPFLLVALVAAAALRLSAVAAHTAARRHLASISARPALRIAIWIALIYAYHIATWPPLILLLYMLAAALLLNTPRDGLFVAALLLPFHFRHKEIWLFAYPWQVAPAQATLLCMVPALFRGIIISFHAPTWNKIIGVLRPTTLQRAINTLLSPWRNNQDVQSVGTTIFDLLAVAWLLINLISIANVWHLPAYLRGLIDLALAPLLFYCAARLYIRTPAQLRHLLTALWIGGVLAALLGWINWFGGIGPNADGIRRLVGPHFSPNHTALYLERTLFLGVGLWLSHSKFVVSRNDECVGAGLAPARGRPQDLPLRRPNIISKNLYFLVSTLIIGSALLLTASRGALLLGIPAGLLTFYLLARDTRQHLALIYSSPLSRLNLKPLSLLLSLSLLFSLLLSLFIYSDRLTNSTTLWRRTQIWQATVELWRDHLWTGVGPNGFFWRYPAYILDQPLLDPNITHPHNIWLELCASWGILGLLWLFATLATIIWLVNPDANHWRTLRNLSIRSLMVKPSWYLRPKRSARKQKPAINTWLTAGLISAFVASVAHAQVDTFTSMADLAAWNWLAFAALTNLSATSSATDQDL